MDRFVERLVVRGILPATGNQCLFWSQVAMVTMGRGHGKELRLK